MIPVRSSTRIIRLSYRISANTFQLTVVNKLNHAAVHSLSPGNHPANSAFHGLTFQIITPAKFI